jgi:hypothetical protein
MSAFHLLLMVVFCCRCSLFSEETMRHIGKIIFVEMIEPLPRWLSQAILSFLVLCLVMSVEVNAHDAKSTGQKIYLPVYSSIAHISKQNIDLTVTLSFRNLDETAPISVSSATYFDTSGKKIKDLLDRSRTMAPFGSTQIIIKQQDFSGDVGANIIIEWSSKLPVTPPLIEAIMVGSRGTQAFSFTSRGIVID